ncbi:MAG: RHS repeat-associated core domain-containing protein, partial [Candidatus Thiodiazotropha endolucinida]
AYLQEQESLNDGHVDETVGYLAIYSPSQGGTVSLYGASFDYQLSQLSLNHTWTAQGNQELLIQEEASSDNELAHTTETLDILQIEGHLFAQDVTTLGWDTMVLRRRGPTSTVLLSGNPTEQGVVYLHTDHLGAVIKATDGDQKILWDAVRKPFGERIVTTAQIEMPLGFPGQYFDEESGNYYNYFRDYDPVTGRYLQSDPIGLAGGINTYSYVGNAPLKHVDPSGEAFINPASGALAGSVFGPPGTAVGAAFGTLVFVGSAAWTAWEMSQAMHSSESMKQKKKGVEEWNKNPPKKPNLYTCRYVMYFPSDQCESGDCPPWVTGRGYDVTLSGAMSQARTEAQDKIPSGCGHQHHGQMWCRARGGPPFMP